MLTLYVPTLELNPSYGQIRVLRAKSLKIALLLSRGGPGIYLLLYAAHCSQGAARGKAPLCAPELYPVNYFPVPTRKVLCVIRSSIYRL